jgi:hypothetical protein
MGGYRGIRFPGAPPDLSIRVPEIPTFRFGFGVKAPVPPRLEFPKSAAVFMSEFKCANPRCPICELFMRDEWITAFIWED